MGRPNDQPTRGVQSSDDKYARVVVEELMPALKAEYNLSPDPDQHAIMGASSGGCAAFAVAWFRPNDFRKVITFVGSFTDIRGEYVYPEWVLDNEKKPIRLFMQDGRNDNRGVRADSYNQSVIGFAKRALNAGFEQKRLRPQLHLGIGNHGQKQGGAIFPEMMRWLWRDQSISTDPYDKGERSFRFPSLVTPARPRARRQP